MKGKNDTPVYFKGIPGESLFQSPFIGAEEIKELNESIATSFRKIENSGDHRSLVLTSELVAEYYLDRALNCFLPNYKKLRKRLSFSLKIDLLKSLKFMPDHILQCSDCIRKIRNEFAHKLDLDNIKDISDENKDDLKRLILLIYGTIKDDVDTEKQFSTISFCAISYLRYYENNIRLLRKKIEEAELIEELLQMSAQGYCK